MLVFISGLDIVRVASGSDFSYADTQFLYPRTNSSLIQLGGYIVSVSEDEQFSLFYIWLDIDGFFFLVTSTREVEKE